MQLSYQRSTSCLHPIMYPIMYRYYKGLKSPVLIGLMLKRERSFDIPTAQCLLWLLNVKVKVKLRFLAPSAGIADIAKR